VKIDTDQLTEARLSADTTRVHLTLLDRDGRKTILSLPTNCLNTIVNLLPGRADPGSVHTLDTWTMGTTENRQDLLLTLRTPEGLAISFIIKPWQVEGMATIATHGSSNRPLPRSVH
jgi:hypothetical protein